MPQRRRSGPVRIGAWLTLLFGACGGVVVAMDQLVIKTDCLVMDVTKLVTDLTPLMHALDTLRHVPF